VCVYLRHAQQTVYVSDDDLPLFHRAQELAGGTLLEQTGNGRDATYRVYRTRTEKSSQPSCTSWSLTPFTSP
jgi:hypothetical protein